MLARADRLLFGIDDTPTQRYGPEVEGAGVHHNPTPGPAGSRFVYGHVWVVLGWLARQPTWGVVALPLLARLYVGKADLPRVPPDHRPAFRTKLELAVELVQWAVTWLESLDKSLWVVADGAYAKAAFLKPLAALGVTVVSRLRKDAALWTAPGPRRPGQRGRTRLYGEQRIDLAKRAGQGRGWQHGVFDLYGKPTAKVYKTFPATWRPAGGLIRVVLVKETRGWVAFLCTDPTACGADVLGAVADRFSLETAFRNVKEVGGAGQQQVRFIWANVGAFHLCLWTYTMTEAWAWGRADDDLAERSASPWDDLRADLRTPTSGRHGGDNCWATKYRRFYGPASTRRKSKLPPNALSNGPSDYNKIAESTVLAVANEKRNAEHEAAPQTPARGYTNSTRPDAPLRGRGPRAASCGYKSLAAQVGGFCGSSSWRTRVNQVLTWPSFGRGSIPVRSPRLRH